MMLLEARDLRYRHSAQAAEAVAGVSLQVAADNFDFGKLGHLLTFLFAFGGNGFLERSASEPLNGNARRSLFGFFLRAACAAAVRDAGKRHDRFETLRVIRAGFGQRVLGQRAELRSGKLLQRRLVVMHDAALHLSPDARDE